MAFWKKGGNSNPVPAREKTLREIHNMVPAWGRYHYENRVPLPGRKVQLEDYRERARRSGCIFLLIYFILVLALVAAFCLIKLRE